MTNAPLHVPITHAPRDQCTDVRSNVIESSAPQYLPGCVCRLYDSGWQSRLAACVQCSAGGCRRREPRSIRSRSSNSSYKIICKSCMPKRCQCAVPVLRPLHLLIDCHRTIIHRTHSSTESLDVGSKSSVLDTGFYTASGSVAFITLS